MGRADPSGRCAARWPRPLQARSADRRGGQSAPGCEPRSRPKPDRRLRPRVGRPLAPHVADSPSLRSCRRGSSPAIAARMPPPPACGYRRRISQPRCGPLRRRLGGRSHPDIDRAPAGSRSAPARVQRPAAADPTATPATASTAGVPSAASPGRRSLASATHQICPPTPTDDHERCYQPPCSRLPGTGDRAAGVDFTLGRCYEYLPTRAGGSF